MCKPWLKWSISQVTAEKTALCALLPPPYVKCNLKFSAAEPFHRSVPLDKDLYKVYNDFVSNCLEDTL